MVLSKCPVYEKLIIRPIGAKAMIKHKAVRKGKRIYYFSSWQKKKAEYSAIQAFYEKNRQAAYRKILEN